MKVPSLVKAANLLITTIAHIGESRKVQPNSKRPEEIRLNGRAHRLRRAGWLDWTSAGCHCLLSSYRKF